MSVTASCAPPPPPIGSGQWLLSSLQRLTDERSLFKPSRVEQVLDLHLTPSPRMEFHGQPPACSGPNSGYSLFSDQYLSNPTWLKPTSQGVEGMSIPAIAINPAEVSGSPKFSYVDSAWQPCSDHNMPVAATREASLVIGGLPAFACYRRRELERRLGEKERLLTDGVSAVDYAANNHDRRPAYLVFTFRFGAPCALSVELNQGVRRFRHRE